VSPARTYVNLVSVFFLCGLWHGASWTFVVWGLYHGAFLVVERLLGRREERLAPRSSPLAPRYVLRHAYVLIVVMVGWVFFRAESFTQAMAFLRAMAGAAHAQPTAFDVRWYLTPQTLAALALGCIGSAPWTARTARSLDPAAPLAAFGRPVLVAVLFTASLLFIAASSYNPFIYFKF